MKNHSLGAQMSKHQRRCANFEQCSAKLTEKLASFQGDKAELAELKHKIEQQREKAALCARIEARTNELSVARKAQSKRQREIKRQEREEKYGSEVADIFEQVTWDD